MLLITDIPELGRRVGDFLVTSNLTQEAAAVQIVLQCGREKREMVLETVGQQLEVL